MIINKFREYAVFDNLMANQLCDELSSAITNDDGNFPANFYLTGAASYALQNEYSGEIPNICFKVTEEETYLKLITYLDRITTKELMRYANRTYFKFQAGGIELCIMIMFETTETEMVNYNGINLEAAQFIKPELIWD